MTRTLAKHGIEQFVDTWVSKFRNSGNIRKERRYINKAIKQLQFFLNPPCCINPDASIEYSRSDNDLTRFINAQINQGSFDRRKWKKSIERAIKILQLTLSTCDSPYPEDNVLPTASVGEAYTQNVQFVSGNNGFSLTIIEKPDWMDITLNEETGVGTFSGTPDVDGIQIPIIINVSNCCCPTDNFTFVIDVEDSGPILIPTVEGIIAQSNDLVDYNAFPYPETLSDNSIISGWKKSTGHAPKGPFMLAKTIDGGATWSSRQITVNGTPIECASIGLVKTGSYIAIAYQDDELYTSVKFARVLESDLVSNFLTADFTACGSLSYLADYSSAPFGAAVKMPSGKIFQPYYSIGIGPNVGKSISALMQSSDNGATWTFGPVIYTEASPNAVPGQVVSETSVAITENTGVDATTKLVAYMRNETTEYYSHARSSDGGTTWTQDTVNFMYEFGNQSAKSPVDHILHNGLIYILCGRRNASGTYTVEFVTCTPANCFTNNQPGYSANTVLSYNVNADTNGAAIDFGYCRFFKDFENKLWCQFYDTAAVQDGGDRNCITYQIKVAD